MDQIRLESVVKDYAVGGSMIRAVDNASITIARGEFISVVGHSGSGKTTLLSMIGGIVQPTSGQVLFHDQDIFGLGSDGLAVYRAEKIGFMFQFASLLPMLTAQENLLLPVLFRSGVHSADDAERAAEELLGVVGLGDRGDSFPSQLSGGQQRRVAIARAFMNAPELILADEPTGDLDEETETEIMSLFRTLNEEKQVTFIFITHNSDLAKQATRRLRMNHGTLAELKD